MNSMNNLDMKFVAQTKRSQAKLTIKAKKPKDKYVVDVTNPKDRQVSDATNLINVAYMSNTLRVFRSFLQSRMLKITYLG